MRKRLHLLVFSLTSLLSLTWFRFKPIVFWDGGLFFLDLKRTSLNELSTFLFYEINGLDPHAYPAQSVTQASLFYSLELNALHTLFPIWLSQFLYVYSLLFLSQVGFHQVCERFSKIPLWCSALGALLYAYSPAYQFVIGDGSISYLAVWCTFPPMLYLLLRQSEEWGNWKSFFKLQLALMVLGLLASVNYSYFEYVGENFALLISSLLISRKFKGILASFLLLQLSYSYFLWWDATFAPKVAVEGLPSIISAYHSYFVYTSKLNGYLEQLTDYYWPLGQPGFIMPSYAPIFVMSPLYGVLVLCCALLPLFKRKQLTLYFVLLLFIAIAAGANPPFSQLANSLYYHFWPYRALTEPFLAVGFAVELPLFLLFSFGLCELEAFTKNKTTIARIGAPVFLTAVIVSSLFVSLPYLAGSARPILPLFSSDNGEISFTVHNVTPRVSFPSYYEQLVNYLNALPQKGAVLLLPIEGNLYTSNWYTSLDMLSYLLNKPVVTGGYLDHFPGLVYAVYEWTLGYKINITRILDEAGVGYIVLQGDAAYGLFMSETPYYNMSYIRERLSQTPSIHLLAQIGPDSVYSVDGVRYTGGNTKLPSTGFYLYALNSVEALNITPTKPYRVLLNATQLKFFVHANCGTLSLEEGKTLKILVKPSCKSFEATLNQSVTISAQTTLYLSYNYSTNAQNASVFVRLFGAKTPFLPLSSSSWSFYAYPPSNYTKISITLQAQTTPNKTVWFCFENFYVSLGYDSQSALTASKKLYVSYLPSLVNSSDTPKVLSENCDAVNCFVALNASTPFVFVWFTAYSSSYTLFVNKTEDSFHTQALGEFNAWVVNKTGVLVLHAYYKNPSALWDALSLGVWLSVFVALLKTHRFKAHQWKARFSRFPQTLLLPLARL